jgi:hypothetical protein
MRPVAYNVSARFWARTDPTQARIPYGSNGSREIMTQTSFGADGQSESAITRRRWGYASDLHSGRRGHVARGRTQRGRRGPGEGTRWACWGRRASHPAARRRWRSRTVPAPPPQLLPLPEPAGKRRPTRTPTRPDNMRQTVRDTVTCVCSSHLLTPARRGASCVGSGQTSPPTLWIPVLSALGLPGLQPGHPIHFPVAMGGPA